MSIRADRVRRFLVSVLLVAAGFPVSAADGERRYELADHGFLRLEVPPGWLDEVREPAPQAPPTIAFRPLEGAPFVVMVTPVWRPRPDMPMPTREGLRDWVERGIDRIRPRAVEKEIRVLEFNGASGPGFYYSATDRAPKPGEFTHLSQGMLRVGELIVTFTILSNADRDMLLDRTLGMLKRAAQAR